MGDLPPRLALLCGNRDEFVLARDAATALGAMLVPINPRLAPAEIVDLLAQARPAVVLVDPALVDLASEVRARADRPAAWLVLADHPTGGLGAALEPVRAAASALAPGDFGATLLFTSGTTGRPKGCVRSAAQERARGEELIATYGLGPADVHLVACPLAHSAPGIFLRACRAAGARTVIMPRFTPEALLAAAAAERATLCFLVPTQVERLLALDPARRAAFDLSAVRAVIVAGAPFAPATRRRLVDWLGPVVWEFYGSSETGTVTVLPPGDAAGHPGSVGRPPPGVELRLLDSAGAPVGPDQVGEVFVRSPALMTGYLDPDTGALANGRSDGFLSVGDLGRRDRDGFLYLVDRVHDTIITGGVNVYPAEVERALAEHPDLAGAVAFGLPDPEWGQVVAAVVAARPGARLELAGVRAFLRGHLGGFKLPRVLAEVGVDELPVGASGKPRRRAAAALLAASPTRRRFD